MTHCEVRVLKGQCHSAPTERHSKWEEAPCDAWWHARAVAPGPQRVLPEGFGLLCREETQLLACSPWPCGCRSWKAFSWHRALSQQRAPETKGRHKNKLMPQLFTHWEFTKCAFGERDLLSQVVVNVGWRPFSPHGNC